MIRRLLPAPLLSASLWALWLVLHVWNLADEAEFIAHFKARYERPLMEIFE